MKVNYLHQKKNFYGNIMWGKESVVGNEGYPTFVEPSAQSDSPIPKFRNLGYYASCFPEGDGMAIQDESGERSPEQVALDIENCFGWNVNIVNM